MSTFARPATAQPRASTARLAIAVPLWMAVIGSRVIVLIAGASGALLTGRVAGWPVYDPHRLSMSLGSVGNALAASTFRWDGIRYVTIAQHGYTTSAQTVSYPLYSLLIRAVSYVVPSPVVAGVLISLACFTVALVLIYRLTAQELSPSVARATVLLLAFAPLSFFFSAVYTESLMLALLAGTFYLARQQRFGWACVTAAGAALTHVEGVLLVAPIAVMYWRAQGSPSNLRALWSPRLLLLALPPLATASFFVYLHTQGWGWLAPVTNDNLVNYERYMTGPAVLLFKAVQSATAGFDQTLHGVPPINPSIGSSFNVGFQNMIYLVVYSITVLTLVQAWRRLPVEYALYATLVVVICSMSAVVNTPLDAFDRYMLVNFPLWIAAAAWLHERRLMPVVLPVSTVMLVFYTVMFARWVFIA